MWGKGRGRGVRVAALSPHSPLSVWPAPQAPLASAVVQVTPGLAHIKSIHPHHSLKSWVCPCHPHFTEENTEAQKGHGTAQGWTASAGTPGSGATLLTSILTALDKATQTVLKAGLANNEVRALVWARGLTGSRGGGRGRNRGFQGQERSEAENLL